jgi:hypothetical protein
VVKTIATAKFRITTFMAIHCNQNRLKQGFTKFTVISLNLIIVSLQFYSEVEEDFNYFHRFLIFSTLATVIRDFNAPFFLSS